MREWAFPGGVLMSLTNGTGEAVSTVGRRCCEARSEGCRSGPTRGQGGQPLLTAIRKIRNRLRTDPWNFGEAEFGYHSLNLVEHVVIVPPLVVHYAVHREEFVVFVMSVTAFSGSGLEG